MLSASTLLLTCSMTLKNTVSVSKVLLKPLSVFQIYLVQDLSQLPNEAKSCLIMTPKLLTSQRISHMFTMVMQCHKQYPI